MKVEKLYGFDYCVKSLRIRNYSGPYFPTLGLITEKYRVEYGPE